MATMNPSDLAMCTACGTQFPTLVDNPPKNCHICDDPRQFVPPQGQSWTCLRKLRAEHHNVIKQDEKDPNIWTIRSEPKIAIGQRCFLVCTPHGNVLWDIIALIDDEVRDFINSKGGLKAIVVSHPHYYTTHAEWANLFNCPIWVGAEDQAWVARPPYPSTPFHLITTETEVVLPGVTAIKTGGHFPGSLLLHYQTSLFIADTMITMPSAYTPHPRPPGQVTYSFMWSIPNSIPLPPSEIRNMWRIMKPFGWEVSYGAFEGMDVRDERLKERTLESMQIAVRAMGYDKEGQDEAAKAVLAENV